MPLKLRLEASSLQELRVAALAALGLDNDRTADPPVLGGEAVTSPAAETIATAETTTIETPPAPADAVTEAKPEAKPKRSKRVNSAAKEEPAVAKEEPAAKKFSRDDVRHAFDIYVRNFGIAAAQIDGRIILQRIFGIGRIGDVPENDQGKLAEAIAAVEMAIVRNEFDRPSVKEAVQ